MRAANPYPDAARRDPTTVQPALHLERPAGSVEALVGDEGEALTVVVRVAYPDLPHGMQEVGLLGCVRQVMDLSGTHDPRTLLAASSMHCAARQDIGAVHAPPDRMIMARSATFRVGTATFAVDGSDRMARRTQAMFADAATAHQDTVDVRLHAAPADEIDDVVQSMTNRRFPYRFDTISRTGGARWRMRTRGGRPLVTVDLAGFPVTAHPWSATVMLHVPQLVAFTAPFVRLPAAVSGHRIDDAFVTLLTDVLEPLLWLRLLDHQSMLLHAGAAQAPGGAGVLFIGASHAGKTATVLELAINRDWNFIGDDLVVVSANGMIRLPKTVRLRQHHARLVDNLPAGAFRGSRGAVHRQVAPSVLVPATRIAAAAPVSTVIRLVTTPAGRPEVASLSRAVMIRQAVAGLFDEYWQFMRAMNSIVAIDDRAAELGTVYDRTCEALSSAVGDGQVLELRVPTGTPAADIADVVDDVVS